MAKKDINKAEENTVVRPWLAWLASAGLLLVMVATMLPLMFIETEAMKYIYAAGALLVVVGRLFSPFKGDNIRVKRLVRMQAWSGIFFCVGAFFLFYNNYELIGPRDWLAFTLAGAVIQVYASFMIQRALKKG